MVKKITFDLQLNYIFSNSAVLQYDVWCHTFLSSRYVKASSETFISQPFSITSCTHSPRGAPVLYNSFIWDGISLDSEATAHTVGKAKDRKMPLVTSCH